LRLVGENQLVRVLIVLEEIKDAVFLHQARDKIEGGLSILNYVFTLWVAALGAVLEILEAMVLKNFLDDFGNGFLLEDLAVGSAREEPGPGNNFGAIVAETIVAADASETAHEAIPMALVVAGVVDLESHLLADDVLEGDGMILGKEIGREMKKLRHAFMAAEAMQKESVLAERGFDGHEALLLGVGHIQNAPFLAAQGGEKDSAYLVTIYP
jgi:hypothetical protein